MSKEVGRKARTPKRGAGPALRAAGRVAIWLLIALLLVRGLGAVLAPQGGSSPARVRDQGPSPASLALATRFARAYLGAPAPRRLAPFLAKGTRVALAGADRGVSVAQVELAGTHELGDGESVLTVACDLRDGRSLYLAVPVSRSRAGGAAVSGAPWVVAGPDTAGVPAQAPRPLAGPDAPAIRALAVKFLPAYLAARSARDLSYLLAPGASVAPLGGALSPLGSSGSVAQLGDGEGRRRTVVVSGRFRDLASGAVYRLAYRLELVKGNRWYVRSVEGALR